MVPSSVEKMNRAGADVPPFDTVNPAPVFATAPVGAFLTLTVNATFEPSARYSVETLVPLSATHQGDVGDAVRPQAFTRLGSVSGATPG